MSIGLVISPDSENTVTASFLFRGGGGDGEFLNFCNRDNTGVYRCRNHGMNACDNFALGAYIEDPIYNSKHSAVRFVDIYGYKAIIFYDVLP